MTNTNNLLPCPFCGAEPKYEVWSDRNYHKAECVDCAFEFDYCQTYEELEASWNKRVAPAPCLQQIEEPAPVQADARDAVWLQPADMAALERFAETTDDDQSYDIGKDSVQRLSSFGCLKNCGFGRYEITSFGSYLLNDWERARILPFTTQADRDAAHRAAIAAVKGE
ncbi:Lar family restriction alleviation protein [Comamonas thiooxydans]|uniref:Lar family restriction alleviation protein n=1 Tax=Comamonas thiooxydans TaxID=363952 RepID=UPI0005F7C9DE|nr:Lar family restriction alleviation protein [Comamonas thiooxydans]CUA99022.1 hypothetical protein Ga0061062_1085 [Comamonas thiooxydans]